MSNDKKTNVNLVKFSNIHGYSFAGVLQGSGSCLELRLKWFRKRTELNSKWNRKSEIAKDNIFKNKHENENAERRKQYLNYKKV